MGHIIVGMDNSPSAATALRWAVREASLHGWDVTAVLVWSYLDQQKTTSSGSFDPAYGQGNAQAALDAAVELSMGEEVARTIERKAVCDLPAAALLRESEKADLLVVGARGLGGFRSLLLGSVSEQCLHHAACPVAVIRSADSSTQPPGETGDEAERIVVGIDGSEDAQLALRWALDEARARGAAVEAVYAWRSPVAGLGNAVITLDSASIEADARLELDRALDAEDTAGLAAPVERVVMVGPSAQVILHAARGADLVVLGSRGLGGFKGLLLGSVSHQVARHAVCPVVVVPVADRG